MYTIGSHNDKYHVTVERFIHRPDDVRLELWRRDEGGSWSSNTQRWIECPEGDDTGQARAEREARSMIQAALAQSAGPRRRI